MNTNTLTAYELIKQKYLTDINSEGYLLRHKKTGARVLLMENDDENKVFTITFRTPPEDSTGLPHILEHSVLCGSKNFPLKDPFVELAKGSLNTFLNAMTYPDKTMYPIASCNDKDFQNLMHVYMDAVFYPNIYQYEEIFRQEGWTYHLESKEGPLTYNGVVYNEMKGAFSSADSVLERVTMNELFPDTSYANESGGDPDVIPELTYEQFLEFHSRYYHPSNSYIYLYGDMDMEEKLAWLDEEYLSKFEKIEINSEIKYQEPFAEMKDVEMTYSISNNESEEDNTYLSYNKVICSILDKELVHAFEILDYVLMSAPGAPLKKALLDAQIGKDIYGSFDDGIRQTSFSIVAKNANLEQKEAFIKVIENTLQDIVKKGIDKKALLAGINYHEFRYREADFGRDPKGLIYEIMAFDSWLYDENDPFMYLEANAVYAFLKKKVEENYFEELIQKYLLDNTHGVVVVVKPEKGRTARLDKELAEKLQAYKENLSDEELQTLIEKTAQLEEYQEAEELEEDLAKIPVLKREDISREIAPIYNEELNLAGVPVLFHEVETNGIGYIDLMFDLSGVPAELVPYVGMLQAVLGIIDTENYEYGELFNEINVHTGGIGSSLELYPNVAEASKKEFKATFEMRSKALYDKLSVTFAMIEEILLRSKLDDEKRLKEIFAMQKSRMQMRFKSSGHSTAALRAMSYIVPMAKFKDTISGIGYFEVLKQVEEHFEEEKGNVIANLKKLTKMLFRPENMMISYTSAREGLAGLEELIAGLKEKLHTEEVETEPCVLFCQKKNEGFKTASKVQYVARGGNFMDAGLEYHGALQILRTILGYEYLWQNIRVKGGAYGCSSSFSRMGDGFFTSFRDPNLEKTNQVYEGVPAFLREFEADEEEMTKYIVGTIGSIDQPMSPSYKGDRSKNLYMNHVSAEMIRRERGEILDATAEDIRGLDKIVEAVLASQCICVVGNEEKIEEQKELFMETRSLF